MTFEIFWVHSIPATFCINLTQLLLGKIQTSMDQLQMHSASAIHNTAWNVVYGHVVLCQTNEEDSDLSKKLYHDLCCQLPRTR